MATYATVAEFEAYTIGWQQTTDPAELEKYLVRAERDVDNLLGRTPARDAFSGTPLARGYRDPATGLWLRPADLTAFQRGRLSNAVCAQTKFRIDMPDLFDRPQYKSVGGASATSVEGTLQRISPGVYDELRGTGLVNAWAGLG